MNDELNRAIEIAKKAHDHNDGPADATAVSIGALIRAVEILAGELKDEPAEQTKPQASPHETHILIESNDGKTAVCVDGGRFDGWILYKHVDGQWVSLRKATPSELDEARALWANKVTPPTSPPTPQPSLVERLKKAYVFAEMEAIAGGGDPVDMGVRAILASLSKTPVAMMTADHIATLCGGEDYSPMDRRYARVAVQAFQEFIAPILAAKDARIQGLETLRAGSMRSLRKQFEFAPQDGDANTGKWVLRADVLNAIDAQVSAANMVAGERLETIERQQARIAELEKQLATARADIEAHVTQARFAAVNLGYPGKTLEDAVRAVEQQKILDGIAAKEAEREQRACVEALSESLLVMPGLTLGEAVKDLIELHGSAKKRVDELATVTSRQVETVKIESERAAYFEQKVAELEKRLADVSVPPTGDGKTPGHTPSTIAVDALRDLKNKLPVAGMYLYAESVHTAWLCEMIDDKIALLEGAKPAPTNEPSAFVASKDVIRGSYFCTEFPFRPYLHVGRDIEFDDIPRILKLGRNDVIEIRVVQRAKQ